MRKLNKLRVLGALSCLHIIMFLSVYFFNSQSVVNNIACLLVLPAIPFAIHFVSTFKAHMLG